MSGCYPKKTYTMKKIKIEQTLLGAALALGVAVSASAQSASSAAAAPPGTPVVSSPLPAIPGDGLLGNNYSEVDFGYLKEDRSPQILHDYDFTYNQAVLKEGAWGTDGNFSYDYLTGSAGGFHDYRDEAQLGLTEYMLEGWGKPFVTADAGYAWQHAGGVSRRSFADTFTGGVEFSVLGNLALTPFVEYQAEPHLYNHEAPVANFPDHLWEYGVKATYRLNREWSTSLAVDMDQYNRNDLGYRAGLSYHF
jgi:hypothetical protein